ncbi:alpha/beta hydrolase [Streptomyces fractus]|uniref:alpha/beta hydrolase n=1 Tax=Streptomyces fractus TaxID=641806 RepID=UPI003CEDAC22
MTTTPNHRLHPELASRIGDLAASPRVDAEAVGRLTDPVGPAEGWDLLIEDRDIPGAGTSIPLRVYRPQANAPARPCLVWMHGGAWVAGDIDMPEAHETARGIAGRADAVVVSVDYRLCGEDVHFPAPHDDVISAYRWVRDHAQELGIDPARIALGGASAGGNLAAGAALHLGEDGETVWQTLLAYPLVHAPIPEPSAELGAALAMLPEAIRLPSDAVRQVLDHYLGAAVDRIPPHAFPGLAGDLRGFPPTYIDMDEFDSLRSSGEQFADQLRAAGVEVEQVTTPGALHGHLNIAGFAPAHATLDRMAARLRKG